MVDVDADVDDDDDASNCYGLCCYVSILCVNGGQVTSAIKLQEKRSRPGLITHLPFADKTETASGASTDGERELKTTRSAPTPQGTTGILNHGREPERPTNRTD